jgi:hypothetical protein
VEIVWHDLYVPVVIVIAIVVVLAVVVIVAAGRGGGMPATERTDYAPLELGPVSATDIVLLRPPTALWGYSQQATDEALERIAESVRERDVRIVALEQLVTDLSREPASPVPLASPYGRPRHARPDMGADAYPDDLAAGGAGNGLAGTGPGETAPNPAQPVPFDAGGPGPGAYDTIQFGPQQQDLPGDPASSGTTPLGAPVADPAGSPRRNMPPWESGTGWPPEVSHD